MNITIEELEKLEPGTFDVIDMRGETEIAHGAIPGSVAIPEQELLENPPENTGKKLIIVCSRGRVSVDVSEELCGRGYEAYSLEGGYIGWLMSEMKKQEAEEICESVEKSIRKKFHKSIWSNFTKAVRQYELVKEGDKKPIILRISDDNMEINIQSQLGSMQEDIDIEKTGKDIMIGFNPKFLIDALRVIDDENVTIYMVNPKAPCYIKDDEQKYVYLILPVNFNTAVN